MGLRDMGLRDMARGGRRLRAPSPPRRAGGVQCPGGCGGSAVVGLSEIWSCESCQVREAGPKGLIGPQVEVWLRAHPGAKVLTTYTQGGRSHRWYYWYCEKYDRILRQEPGEDLFEAVYAVDVNAVCRERGLT